MGNVVFGNRYSLRSVFQGAAWLSSARAVRCRVKSHNERNPYRQLPSVQAGHSVETATVRCEEGGDDVKSARPLHPGRHTCYNGRYRGQPRGDPERISKAGRSSDWSLQPDSTKLDSLVIAHQPHTIDSKSKEWCQKLLRNEITMQEYISFVKKKAGVKA